MPDDPQAILEQFKKLIALNDCHTTISGMVELLRDAEPELRNEVLIQKMRLTAVDKDERRGTLSRNEAAQERLRIQYALADFVEELSSRFRLARLYEPPTPPVSPTNQIPEGGSDAGTVRLLSSGTITFRFDIAFSFAGPHRETVRAIAELIAERLGRQRVFFDEWYEHEFLGDDMDVLLQRFYHQQSLMVVADISDEYTGRPWCQAEARAIRALRFELDPARDEIGRLRLLNVRLSEGSISSIFRTTAYLDGVNKSKKQCAELILNRHSLIVERMGGLKTQKDS